MSVTERALCDGLRFDALGTEGAPTVRRARLRRSRAAERGAVLLESVLVIAILLLSLIGSVYAARIYHTSLRPVAVSRAAAIGY